MQKNLGKYELIEHLGSGATADVYFAHDTLLGRDVAIKILKPALVADISAFARFAHEAQAASRLFHPNISTVLDMGEFEGRYFIAMRYIPGESLDKIVRERAPLPWQEALHMAQQIGAALDFAHQQGFVHRDVKPSNIIRTPEGDYMLTDFGLTRAMMSTGLTSHTGAVLGTPSYIPPEIWQGEPAVPATDQYALACVVVEMLSGRALFTGETPPAIMTSHVLKGARLPENWPSDVPPGVTKVLTCALSRVASERYASVGEFTTLLAESGDASTSKPAEPVIPMPVPPPQTTKAASTAKIEEPKTDVAPVLAPTSRPAPQAAQTSRRIFGLGIGVIGFVVVALVVIVTVIILSGQARANRRADQTALAAGSNPTVIATQLPVLAHTQSNSGGEAAATPTALSTPTTIPSRTVTPTALAVESINEPLFGTINKDTWVRTGPGIMYIEIDDFIKGTQVEIIGRNNEETWLVVTLPDGTYGWIASDVVDYSFEASILPTVQTPPPPTSTPIPVIPTDTKKPPAAKSTTPPVIITTEPPPDCKKDGTPYPCP